jgi:hypothetical protein
MSSKLLSASTVAVLALVPWAEQEQSKGAFTLANFARDFALSLHVLLNKNYLFSLLNMQASAKLRAKSRRCKCTLMLLVVSPPKEPR